ncbi:MAG: hypothetical protein WAX89_02705, partial [Alphaproteobacteria bacterium]
MSIKNRELFQTAMVAAAHSVWANHLSTYNYALHQTEGEEKPWNADENMRSRMGIDTLTQLSLDFIGERDLNLAQKMTLLEQEFGPEVAFAFGYHGFIAYVDDGHAIFMEKNEQGQTAYDLLTNLLPAYLPENT